MFQRLHANRQEREGMGRAEAVRAVDAPIEDVFGFTDWCYNNPEWASIIHKSWITRLPDPNGLGKITHYIGTIMGRDLEWDGTSVVSEHNRHWAMKAISGLQAKMNMQVDMYFDAIGPRKTKVTLSIGYRARHAVIGRVLERVYMRREA